MSENIIAHEGVGHLDDPPGRGSGRYGWGTGQNPGQHQYNFMSEVQRFRSKGMVDKDIARALLGPDATLKDLRMEIAIANSENRRAETARARELMAKYNNKSEVGRIMGKSDTSVAKLLDESLEASNDKYQNTAEMIKNRIDELGKPVIISPGTNLSLNVTDNTMDTAIRILEKQGYIKAMALVPQQTSKDKTTIAVLCPPDTPVNRKADENGKIKTWVNWKEYPAESLIDYSPDEGKTWETVKPPESLNSKRIQIRYKEDGGADKDGVIEIRKGVKDLDLGGAQYAQVRIAVDGTHYLKGMAMYGDDMPDGIDIIFNTNKKKGTPMMDEDRGVLKPLKTNDAGQIDKENPFGALIKRGGQSTWIDENGKEHLSPINKLREEGDWDSWSKNLASQFLSKQPIKIINQQIDLSLAQKKSELQDIMDLTNPVIKKKMLEDFSNKCDANANDLSVIGFRNQAYQVLLPVPKMKDNEIYAPAYKDGDTVALVRYPHGGTFEIPILKVNNKNKDAAKVMGGAKDAVGINPTNAAILSGADFDGDAALVIPLKSNRLSITSTAYTDIPAIKTLKEFDPKSYYKPGLEIAESTKQKQMGVATNLITDMTVAGATWDQIVRATKYSMVVIDSKKHQLDYKQAAKDFKIQELKKEYQDGGGASTIFSRADAKGWTEQRKVVRDTTKMTPAELKAYEAGKVIYRPTGKTKTKWEEITDPSKMTASEKKTYESGKKVYRDTGKTELVTQRIKGMETVSDATDLVRNKNDVKEMAYANYANSLIGLADQARREYRSITPTKINQTAKNTYAAEVDSLNSKLRIAESNKPKENLALMIAATRSSERIKSNPGLDYEHKSRIRAQEMEKARDEVGAHKKYIDITDREWEAIQANAISSTKLEKILDNTKQETYVKLATPKDSTTKLSSAKKNLIQMYYNNQHMSQAEIAEKFGISRSTVSSVLNET